MAKGPRRFEKKKARRQRIARERIELLLKMAEQQALAGEMELANRYAFLARRIGMRYKVKMPRGFKLNYCRQCNSFLVSGSNARTRIHEGRITRQCLKCGTHYRLPIGRN